MADHISPPLRERPSVSPGTEASSDDSQTGESRSDTPKQIVEAKEFWDRLGL